MVISANTGISYNPGGGSPGGAAGGDLGGTYPNPTVVTAHITGGTINGTPIGATTPSTIIATTITASNLASGTYTPTVLFTSNASTSFIGTFMYQRVANIVTVTGIITIAVTSSASSGNVRLSLPVASSLTTSNQATGFGSTTLAPGAGSCSISAFPGDNSANMTIWATGTSNNDFGVTFSYTVQ